MLPDITTALRTLVAEGTLTEAQAARTAEVLREAPAPGSTPSQRSGRLSEIAGYLGAALLLAAVTLFLTSGWGDLSENARTAVLAVLGAILVAAGAAVGHSSRLGLRELGRQDDSARRRLVSVLWTFGAASLAAASGLAVHAADIGSWELLTAGATGLALSIAAYSVVPGLVGQLGMYAASILLVSAAVERVMRGSGSADTTYAVVLVALGAVWAALGLRKVVHDREAALLTGAGLALIAAQLPIMNGNHQNLGYLLTAIVAVAGFVGYLSTRSFSVLAAGVVATTLVVPEALHHWTDGSLSAAASLLVAGLTLLAASAAGLRLRQEAQESS